MVSINNVSTRAVFLEVCTVAAAGPKSIWRKPPGAAAGII
jgi:hypothetical protein